MENVGVKNRIINNSNSQWNHFLDVLNHFSRLITVGLGFFDSHSLIHRRPLTRSWVQTRNEPIDSSPGPAQTRSGRAWPPPRPQQEMSLGGKTASSPPPKKDNSQNKIARTCISFCFMNIRECGLPAPASRLMLFSTATPLSSRSLCFSATSSSCRWTAWTVKSWRVNHGGHSFNHGSRWSENQRRRKKACLFH